MIRQIKFIQLYSNTQKSISFACWLLLTAPREYFMLYAVTSKSIQPGSTGLDRCNTDLTKGELYLADPGEAIGCSTNIVFWRPQAQMFWNFAFSHKKTMLHWRRAFYISKNIKITYLALKIVDFAECVEFAYQLRCIWNGFAQPVNQASLLALSSNE